MTDNPIGLPETSKILKNQDDDEDHKMIRNGYLKCFVIIGFGIAFIITGSIWLGNSNSAFDDITGSFGIGVGFLSIVLGGGLGIYLYKTIKEDQRDV